MIVFFHIATQWPALMKVWAEKEKRFLHFPYKLGSFRLSRKCKFTAATIGLLAFFEHSLFLWSSFNNHYMTFAKCNRTMKAPISYFLEHQFPFMFEQISFSLPLGIFVEIMNMSFTFNWNYMELFGMMISIGMMTRFNQINRRLDEVKGKVRKV